MKVTIEGSWGEIACLLRSLSGEDLDDIDRHLVEPHPDSVAPPPPAEPEPYQPPAAPPPVVRPGDMLARAIGTRPDGRTSPSSSIEAAAERRRRMAGVVLPPPEDDAETADGTDQPEKF